MDLADRIYHLHQILRQARLPVPHATIEERLECSRATATRVIRDLRDYLGAPIEYDRHRGGYLYAPGDDGPWELPGLWFSAAELHALLTAQQLLARAARPARRRPRPVARPDRTHSRGAGCPGG